MPVQLLVKVGRQQIVGIVRETYVQREHGKRVVDRALLDDDVFCERVFRQIVFTEQLLKANLRPLFALRTMSQIDCDRRSFRCERREEADDGDGCPSHPAHPAFYFPTMCPRSRLFSWQMYSYSSAPAAQGIV